MVLIFGIMLLSQHYYLPHMFLAVFEVKNCKTQGGQKHEAKKSFLLVTPSFPLEQGSYTSLLDTIPLCFQEAN